jgi:hypothetical protein
MAEVSKDAFPHERGIFFEQVVGVIPRGKPPEDLPHRGVGALCALWERQVCGRPTAFAVLACAATMRLSCHRLVAGETTGDRASVIPDLIAV